MVGESLQGTADVPRAALFVTCLVDTMRPVVGFAAIRLLETAGCHVVVPETQTCCGQPALNSGNLLSRTDGIGSDAGNRRAAEGEGPAERLHAQWPLPGSLPGRHSVAHPHSRVARDHLAQRTRIRCIPPRHRAVAVPRPTSGSVPLDERSCHSRNGVLRARRLDRANAVSLRLDVNLVTGPSGTTDIEGTLVRGAHGPGHLHVVLVGGETDSPSLPGASVE
jgi:Cysteine-rich domain/LUD domain